MNVDEALKQLEEAYLAVLKSREAWRSLERSATNELVANKAMLNKNFRTRIQIGIDLS